MIKKNNEMLRALQHWLDRIRQCPVCGARSRENHIYCEPCSYHLSQEMKPDFIFHPMKFEIFSLYPWGQTNHKIIEPLLRSLKGGGLDSFFNEMAYEIVKNFQVFQRIDFDMIIPIPGHITNRRDHAEQLAHYLSLVMGVPYVNCLKRNREVLQKTLALNERKKLQFEILQKAQGYKFKKICLVDDIVTTGSTLGAAAKVLKNQNIGVKIISLTIARRLLNSNNSSCES